jgi:UDP-glucose 4-epimerase
MLKPGTRVLVTGGAGFLGCHVTRALVNAGCQVRVLDDLSSGKRERLVGLGPTLELLRGDVRNPSAVERAARGAHVIVHLAASPIGSDPMRAQEVQLGGALNILNVARAAERAQRPRVVLVGSGSVYGRQTSFVLHEELAPHPTVPQAVMALAAEQYGRVYHETYGVPVVNLRLFRTYGPEEEAERPDASIVARFIRAALDGTSPIIYGDGQQTRDLIYVENAVQAILAACQPGLCDQADPLNIASGEAVTLNFLWTLVLELVGKRRLAIEATYVPAPPWDPKHARPQIQRSCHALSWAPSVRLRDGLTRTTHYYLAMRSADPNAWFAPREETPPPRRPVAPPMSPPRPGRSVPPPPPMFATGSAPRKVPAPPLVSLPPPPIEASPAIQPGSIQYSPDPPARADNELNFEWAPVPPVPGFGR